MMNNTQISVTATCNVIMTLSSNNSELMPLVFQETTTLVLPDLSAEELLKKAVNNRTRERNYFRLYCQLLEGEITEEEFDREIDENEDNYVVSNNKEATIKLLSTARRVIDGLMDVDDLDSIMDLFSFNQASVRKCLTQTI